MKTDAEKAIQPILSYSFTVEKGKIKEFVQSIGDSLPIYYEEEEANKAGYKGIPIPPTFATVVDFWGGLDFETLMKALKLNPLKVLHGEQEYQYFAQIYAGDPLDVTAKVLKQIEKKNMRMFVIETEYARVGEKVLVARSTIIETK
ncbi:hypothetical protein J2S13_001896 [Oikeobacillus pervagus]|uniref:FAS1-like dehydratase domain-containing protein n=1 Tax=Oikeobacillus pervagus TaxID=1325931 RepID=A0AAJ1WJH7_9BACI|nr:MaoC family dehydratase N-terminal domain-containing protein [Oikeobacillus pervagus]MDQ0215478.1 hypothetical protein [Oikeobacillus pervagus]